MKYVIVFNPNTCAQTCHASTCSAATGVEGLRVRGETEFDTVEAAFADALADERERGCKEPHEVTKVYGWKVHKCAKV
jgi:hypothetical protein